MKSLEVKTPGVIAGSRPQPNSKIHFVEDGKHEVALAVRCGLIGCGVRETFWW